MAFGSTHRFIEFVVGRATVAVLVFVFPAIIINIVVFLKDVFESTINISFFVLAITICSLLSMMFRVSSVYLLPFLLMAQRAQKP